MIRLHMVLWLSLFFLLRASASFAIEAQIIDGDSFATPDGEIIRIENIDTPSVGDGARCTLERQRSENTVARIKQLLSACPVEFERRYRDSYGRTEARVSVCGQDLGELLIKEGLATIRGDIDPPWCR
jgi:endonuclease YncB( thermonuclease family)